MFEPGKSFYMTKSVVEELSAEHHEFLLQYIHEYHKLMTDYLQIFDFYIKDGKQWLIQRQEQPKRETTVFIELQQAKPMESKVWVMDQQDHIIILCPSDY